MEKTNLIGMNLGVKSLVLELYNSNKRDLAYLILDHLYENAKSLYDFDLIGDLSIKTEYRKMFLQCSETAYSIALLNDQKYMARKNLIKAYSTMNYPDKALEHIKIQLSIDPNDLDMLLEKASNLSLLNKKEEGEEILNFVKKNFPEKEKDVESLLSGKYLREGNLVKGIEVFLETYKPKHKVFDEILNMKRWDGISRPGKILYVNGEGGIGDEIIHIRFFNNIKKLGMRPILVSPDNTFLKDKNDLFRRHGIEILPEMYSINPKEYWIPCMSLPVVLRLKEDNLWNGSYLYPIRNEKNKIDSRKFKIGIKCSGNPYFQQDEYRKIPIEKMLQYLPHDAELFYIDKIKINNPKVIDLADRITSWEDTLDFIDQMDIIVSSCTSLVHAAGAIGKETIVCVPISEYYIWTSKKRDSTTPWYGENFHVFRQSKLRSWDEPLSEMEQLVKKIKG
jgi:tetratricopeptide (TPR) repeat protein